MSQGGFTVGVKRGPFDATQRPDGVPLAKISRGPGGSAGLERLRATGDRRFLGPRANDQRQVAMQLGGLNPQQVAGLRPWAPNVAGPPRAGTTPSFQTVVRGEQGVPMFGGFGPMMNASRQGIVPTQKDAGTSEVAWAGFGAMRGRGAQQVRAQSDIGNMVLTGPGTMVRENDSPFRSVDWQRAASQLENQRIGLPSNDTVAVHRIQKVAAAEFDYNTQKGQCVVLYKGDSQKDATVGGGADGGGQVPLPGAGTARPRYTDLSACRFSQFNHVVLNYILARTEKDPATPDDVLTPDQVWESWSFAGIVISEQGDAQTSGFGEHPENPYEERTRMNRILNLAAAGRVTAQNIWGRHLQTGTRLWFILKKVPVEQIRADARSGPGTFMLDPSGHSVHDVQQKANRLSRCPFQLVPWARPGYDEVPPEELKYCDDFGSVRMGKAIHVGLVEDFATNLPTGAHRHSDPYVATNVAHTLVNGVVSVLVSRRPVT